VVIGGLLLVGLVVVAVLFVVVPLLRSGASKDEWTTATAEQARRIELRERRDAAYVALRELELDHDTGKLDDEDYATANAELRAEAVAALAALEEDERRTAAPPET
jgi:cytochrome c-type biogenesis protein CcmI